MSNGDMDSKQRCEIAETVAGVPEAESRLIFLTGAILASIMRASISFTGTVQWRYIHQHRKFAEPYAKFRLTKGLCLRWITEHYGLMINNLQRWDRAHNP